MSDSASVFISYSTKDIHFVERLRARLKAANVPYWIDKEGLQAGTQNWEKAIRAAIRESSSVILVASPNAYESNYVQDEIAIAQMHGRTIYPVWAEGEHWIACVPMGMGKTQHVDLRGDSFESNFAHLVKALGGADPSLAYVPPPAKAPSPGVTRRSPYKGLEAFQEKDAGDFFGRTVAINELVNRFRDRATSAKGRLLAVIGASGSGKSSVVMAGLLPRLKAGVLPGSESWLYVPPITPGNAPIRALTRGLSKVFPDKSFGAIEDDLQRPNGQGLANLAYAVDQRVVLYIDQFEELFMPGVSADERDQYISLIVQAANEPGGNLVVLLTLRADFYDRPTNYRELGALISQNNHTLLPMSLAELREAVEGPTQLPDVGLLFESGLVGEIVFELHESKDRMALAGALPLLQFTLQQLYERRDQTSDIHILTGTAYNEIGGVSGAISQHAETAFRALDEDAQNRLGRVFFRLINVDERGEATRERANLSIFENDDAAMRLIDRLVDERLLLANREQELSTLEVAHEALLRNWNRLVQWIESAAESKRLLQKLEVDAEFWAKRGKPRDQYRYTYELETEIRAIRNELGIGVSALIEEYLQPEIIRLIDDLRDSATDGSAMKRISGIGVATVPYLIAALDENNNFLRVNVVSVLKKLGVEAVPPLVEALQVADNNIKVSVAEVLGSIEDPRAVEPLIATLNDPDAVLRNKAAEVLGKLKDSRAVAPLIVSLSDPNPTVRERATLVLGEFRDKSAVEPLLSLLDDTEITVRRSVTIALGKLGDSRAVEPLISAIQDPSSSVRENAVEALHALGDLRAVDALIGALGDSEENVQWKARDALISMSNVSVQPLISALNDPNVTVRWHAADVLGRLGNREAVVPLIAVLGHPDPNLRWRVANSLGRLGDRSAVDYLLSALSDSNPKVRYYVAGALGNLRDKRAIPALEALQRDAFASVRDAGKSALAEINR